MFVDKMRWLKIEGKHLWAGLGLSNLLAVGYYTAFKPERQNWEYHFCHIGDDRFFQPFKSLFASRGPAGLFNGVALIGGGYWL